MSVDERHRRLYARLEAVLGSEEAQTLIDDQSARIVTPELLHRELDSLADRLESRLDLKLEALESRVDARLSDRINEQTKLMFRTVIVSNAAMVLAVGGLAFGAARLA